MPAFTVSVDGRSIRLSCPGGTSLKTVLRDAGVTLPMPCGGTGRCGKCKIRAQGALSPLASPETEFLTPHEQAAGFRLACYARVLGDIAVQSASGACLTLSAISLPPHHCSGGGSGLAADIGTTTLAVQLYDLATGALLGEALEPNRQSSFGADVISRIECSNQHGPEPLCETLRQQLEELSARCMRQAGVSALDTAVLTGNTTMLHFWEGLDPKGIAVAPFTPVSLFGQEAQTPLSGVIPYLPPCIGPYIGGDISCDILASGLLERPDETALLVDLGTNGEIALQHEGRLYCASTAMGPALEGASLRYGMQAGPGAVTAVARDEQGAVVYESLGGCAPSGICGSGVLDAVRVMLETGALDETGLLCATDSNVRTHQGCLSWSIPGTQVWITQEDIRQIQLAKAAVYAGIRTLLDVRSLRERQVDRLYIAGGFGHSMNLDSAAAVGLFPASLRARAVVLGNGALSGAVLALLDQDLRESLSRIALQAEEIPLSGNQRFSGYYIDSILFESEN